LCVAPNPTLHYFSFFSICLFSIRLRNFCTVESFNVLLFLCFSKARVSGLEWQALLPGVWTENKFRSARICDRGLAVEDAKPWASFAKLHSRSNRAVRRWMKVCGVMVGGGGEGCMKFETLQPLSSKTKGKSWRSNVQRNTQYVWRIRRFRKYLRKSIDMVCSWYCELIPV